MNLLAPVESFGRRPGDYFHRGGGSSSHLEVSKFETRAHGAPHKRVLTQTPCRLPLTRVDDQLWSLPRTDVWSENARDLDVAIFGVLESLQFQWCASVEMKHFS